MKQVTLKEIREGEYFKFTPNGKVYVRGYYERSEKKYECYQFDDVNHECFTKGDRKIFIDFEF